MRANYVLNINSGTVCVRTMACDDHPMILRPIDDETALAILKGKVKASVVIEALTKAEMSAEGFNWREYDAKRRAAEEKFNVSKREMIPVSEEEHEASQKQDENIVSFKDLGLGDSKENTSKKPEKKQGEDAAAKAALAGELDGIFGK